jgi:hypothetical protein
MRKIFYYAKFISKSNCCFKIFLICLFSTFSATRINLLAQNSSILTKQDKSELIELVCNNIKKYYPFTEIGTSTIKGIKHNFNQGKYTQYNIPTEFAQHLGYDLGDISEDKHLTIFYDPQLAKEIKEIEEKGIKDSYAASSLEAERWNNFGFKELKLLEGNIGYMNLEVFFALKYAGETAVAAMNFFSNCNAIIIDLRKNGGGWDDMVTFLASYFFDDDESVVFNVSHSTLDDSYYSSMTMSYVPGKILADIPLYILISGSTASAAEAFASIMKNMKDNATLIGEKTAGAENPVDHIIIKDHYILRIPCWEKIYSYTDAGWEGVGVLPDIEVASDNALTLAHMNALTQLRDVCTDESMRDKYQWAIDGVNAITNPQKLPKALLRSYTGRYGNREVFYEKGVLFYKYKDRKPRKMFVIKEDYFLIDSYSYFRINFIKEKGTVVGMKEIFTDGRILIHNKM